MRKISATSVLIYLVSIMPFPILYLLSDFMYLVLYKIVGYRTKVVRENLRKSFPHKSKEELRQIEREFYRFLPDVILEALKMRTITPKQLNKRFTIENPQELKRHFAEGRAVVGVTAHYANWEWGLHKSSLDNDVPFLVLYKPLSNKGFDKVFNAIRSRFGAIMVPMKQSLRYLAKYRNTPHLSMFVADQSPGYQESDYFINFLNQPTLVFTGPARIAQKMNAALVYCHIDRVKRGRYTCRYTTLTEDPNSMSAHELTDVHNRFTEQIIINKPALWMWSHRRWKRKPRTTNQ